MPALLTKDNKADEGRRVQRIPLTIPMRVEGKDSPTDKWDEITRLKDISPFGAGFTLSRPIKRGRLVQLTLPMPRKMRCFDFAESQYKVWCIVRRCITLDNDPKDKYFIGVAFIGKLPPKSYTETPSKIYEISHRDKDGLWQITSAESNPDESGIAKEDRRHSRYGIPLNLTVEVTDNEGNVQKSEPTVSENISLGGASIFTSFSVETGTYLKITSSQYDTSIKAIVRGKRIAPDGIPRLHIEFIDSFFPLEGIEL